MVEEFYGCPTCSIRHSAEAWTYRTRYELGILNVDREDIIHITEKEKLKEIQSHFFCPSCGSSNMALEIFEFNRPFTEAKIVIRTMLNMLLIKGGSMIGLKSRNKKYINISVDYHQEDNYFDVRYQTESSRCIVQPIKDIEEVAECLLTLEVIIPVKYNKGKDVKRKRK